MSQYLLSHLNPSDSYDQNVDDKLNTEYLPLVSWTRLEADRARTYRLPRGDEMMLKSRMQFAAAVVLLVVVMLMVGVLAGCNIGTTTTTASATTTTALDSTTTASATTTMAPASTTTAPATTTSS